MKFEFICLGTGCPIPSPERMGPSHLVEINNTKILIDCGSGVTQRLVQAKIKSAEIDALIITHYHSDHIVDFWQLVVSSWHQGRSKPWNVFTTATTIKHLQKQIEAYSDEIKIRISHEQRQSVEGLKINFIELSEETIHFSDFKIRPFLVDHEPILPAYGLSFEAFNFHLVFSGDTKSCQSLINAVQGADLLIQEVFVDREMNAIPGIRTEKTIEAVKSYHTVPDEISKIASEGKVKTLMLTHIVPPSADRLALVKEINRNYDGTIIIAEDLMRFDLINKILTSYNATLRIR